MNNTVVRTITGIVFLAIMVGSLLVSPIIFAVVMAAGIALMMLEFFQISLGKSYSIVQLLSVLTGVALYLMVFSLKGFEMDLKYLYLLTLPISGIFISFLYKRGETYNKYPFLICGILYIALPFALTNTILFDAGEYKPLLLLSLFIMTWASDVGAYIIGMKFGQKNGHKLFPSISPKKSWEGFFGGLFFAIVAAVLIYFSGFLEISLTHIIIISLIVNIGGAFGDLVESQFKRNFDVKDSGNLMPGHGGLLDRFDSTLVSFPVAITYIKIFSLIS